MALGLGALQIVLGGQQEDWFDSPLIPRLAVVAGLALRCSCGSGCARPGRCSTSAC